MTIFDSMSIEEEGRIVADLRKEAKANEKEGDLYFAVSCRWISSWNRFVAQDLSREPLDVPRPGPIDNSDLIDSQSDASGPKLRKKLVIGTDYHLVPEQVWKKLVEWYDGGPIILTKLRGLLHLKLTDGRDGSSETIKLSEHASVDQLYEMVCSSRGVPKEKARIWVYFHKDKMTSVLLHPSSERTLKESLVQVDSDILLEVAANAFPKYLMSWAGNELPAGPTRSDASNGYSNGSTFAASSDSGKQGLRGLKNLGNTCFMNCPLQCLAHTPPIRDYFLKDCEAEINKDDRLGTGGSITTEFGALLRRLWSSGKDAVAPVSFKTTLASFQPQYSGYNQHDCHEILSFLLNALHEDLNRVKQKPYTESKDSESKDSESKDSDGRPDDEVAEEKWKYHKARNDSVIVDVCQGQDKSTLVCPVCGTVSSTFGLFMCLTLPFPRSYTRSMTVSVFNGDGNCFWKSHTVTVPKDGSVGDLRVALRAACGLKYDESLLLADVFDHKFFCYLENPLQSLSEIREKFRIVAFRFNNTHRGPEKELLEIRHCKQGRRKLFGIPLATYVSPKPHSRSDIDAIISGLLSPLNRTRSSSGSLEDTTVGFSVWGVDRKQPFRLKPLESSVDPRGVTRLAVEWGEKEHEKYDSSSFLSDPPQIFKEISLYSCLGAYLEEETDGTDWLCSRCKVNRQANKRIELLTLPEILMVHLGRFSRTGSISKKITEFVDFPIHDFDLSKYVKNKDGESYLYELYAIINHHGGDTESGHYTAYVKLMDENKWYKFDDDRVSAIDESKIKTPDAYVLFYRRVRNES